MIIDNTLDELITKELSDKNKKESFDRIISDKLTASILGDPLQWQILKVIGIRGKEIDSYLLRKFERGNDVEAKIYKYLDKLGKKEDQIYVTYKNVVGKVDAIVEMKNWKSKLGEIPHEIKSISNAKFNRLRRQNNADAGHILQACLYALALDSEQFAIDYISTDDYRILTYIYETDLYQDRVENTIIEFNNQIKLGKIPKFEHKQLWQKQKGYCKYPEWMKLNENEIDELLETKYKDNFKKLLKLQEEYKK